MTMAIKVREAAVRARSLGPRRAYRALVRRLGYFWGPRLMSAIRKRWVLIRNPHADVRFGKGVYLGPGFSLDAPNRGIFIVGDYVEFRRNFRAELRSGARITIGPGCVFTYDVRMQCYASIEVGARCAIGATFIVDGNHHFRDLSKPMLAQGWDHRPIRIEDDVSIHVFCAIVNSIGERSVIAAGSVVTEPIPPYCLAAGAPAKVRDYFGPDADADGKPAPGNGGRQQGARS